MLLKRYRVELIVDDGSDTASFIIFNKDLTKILKKSPVELINYIETINDVETEENAVVSFLNENLVGEEFIFTIRINSYNFRSTSSGITIIETHKKDSATNNENINKSDSHINYNCKKEEDSNEYVGKTKSGQKNEGSSKNFGRSHLKTKETKTKKTNLVKSGKQKVNSSSDRPTRNKRMKVDSYTWI
ncbi:hypothetical protein YC2023_076177 [Brassica napus]|uniref:(rape) hypothetical protein n=1 Tax=Brassica napus TaxID=3708 RepID=A0A816Q251_BRANA|nr:unnamed protein product [Brassica napus]